MLVVEDEVRLAQALQRGLRAEGFAVDLAHDGETDSTGPRGRVRRGRPRRDAAQAVRIPGHRALRAEQNWVPVLMLSAKDGEYDQADGLDVGADDYLTKPFSYVVLVARLRALLRRSPPPRPPVLDRR